MCSNAGRLAELEAENDRLTRTLDVCAEGFESAKAECQRLGAVQTGLERLEKEDLLKSKRLTQVGRPLLCSTGPAGFVHHNAGHYLVIGPCSQPLYIGHTWLGALQTGCHCLLEPGLQTRLSLFDAAWSRHYPWVSVTR